MAAMGQAVSDMIYVIFLLAFSWQVVFGEKNYRTDEEQSNNLGIKQKTTKCVQELGIKEAQQAEMLARLKCSPGWTRERGGGPEKGTNLHILCLRPRSQPPI